MISSAEVIRIDTVLPRYMKLILITMIVFLGFSASLTLADNLKLTKDEDNVVSRRLEGSWIVDSDLSFRLTGKAEIGEGLMQRVTFESDDAIFGQLPKGHRARLQKEMTSVYMCGWMAFGQHKFPFLLIEQKGNSKVLFFLKNGKDIFGNGVYAPVMLAVGADRKNDLLFMGSDFRDQPFRAFQRADDER